MRVVVNSKQRVFLLLFCAVMAAAWLVLEFLEPHTCTIFTAVQGDTVLFGDNLDYHEGDLVIGFYPTSAAGYGSVHFGYRTGEGESYQRAVNDQGLAWAVNRIPTAKLNPHPEKAYAHADDNYFSTITNRAATVEEAIRLAKDFDFGDELSVQIHIADARGDAVVISPGSDGEIAFTRKPAGDGYLLSTNFNRAIPEKGPVDFRWDTATSMLETLSPSQPLLPEFAGDILEAVHLKTLTTHTLHSNVIDLKSGEIYIYYMSQYGEAIHLNIADELAKGQRVVETRSLFSADTAQAGDASYHKFETRFRIAQVTVIIIGLVVFGSGGAVAFKKFETLSQTPHVITGISL